MSVAYYVVASTTDDEHLVFRSERNARNRRREDERQIVCLFLFVFVRLVIRNTPIVRNPATMIVVDKQRLGGSALTCSFIYRIN